MSDEEDYMSSAFLVEPSSATTFDSMTYSQRRQKAMAKSYEKSRNLSRREREAQAREAGLSTSLITTDEATTKPNKALSMMQKMGFKPGQALGRPSASDSASPATPSIGTTDATQSNSNSNKRTLPLDIQLRVGKGGIGTEPQSKRRRGPDGVLLPDQDEMFKTQVYKETSRELFDERKAESILRGARRTCEELDRRIGMTKSVMWIDPKEYHVQLRRKAHALRMGERLGEDDEAFVQDLLGTKKEDVESEEVDPEDGTSKEEWLELDAKTRLNTTLGYLRDKHKYCLWCGTQYDSQEDLDSNCPGEAEADHD